MAKKKRATGRARRDRLERWAGLGLAMVGLYLLVSLLTYVQPMGTVEALRTPDGIGASTTGARGPLADVYANVGGTVGRVLAGGLVLPLGWITVWAVPLLLLVWGWNRMRRMAHGMLSLRTALAVPLALAFMTTCAALGAGMRISGTWGLQMWLAVEGAVGPAGGILLLLAATFGFLLLEAEALSGRWGLVTRRTLGMTGSLIRLAGTGLRRLFATVGASLGEGVRSWRERRAMDRETEAARRVDAERLAEERRAQEELDRAEAETARPPVIVDNQPGPFTAAGPTTPVGASDFPEATTASTPTDVPSPHADTEEVIVRRVSEGVTGAEDVGGVLAEAKRESKKRGVTPRALFATMRGKFTLPSSELLSPVPSGGQSVPEDELVENSRILTETLRDFGIQGRVGEVHPGPVITRYEFTPGPGVKVSQIVNRSEDLALKLRAIRIRIVAPIPGKAAVGIEVPNHNPQTIYLRQILESKSFLEAGGPLSLALGKDINGVPITAELTKMPHLLVAGTTGSGKSVCMNALVTSLLLKHSPENLRMLMIDPKMLELPMYNGIPHLLTEVVTDPKLAARSLKWLIVEMERRYQVLAKRGSRNILSYNQKLKAEGPLEEGEESLPYIVALIDELADLMITSGKEVEEPIARLAQMARAVGIHLIVATQRPSVDVLTGVIKANFPSRIAFQVASKTDSRTILDQNGAETLLGRGDMLFLPPGTAAPERVHGAFVTEEETQALVHFLREQGAPQGDLGLEEALTESEVKPGAEWGDDDRFEDAARVVVTMKQGSASLLQRRLKVGYARAGRLVDMLEAAGVVAPADGSKPRDVLLDEVQLEQLLRDHDA